MSEKQKAKIKDWLIMYGNLWGVCVEHPLLPADKTIRSSSVVSYDLEKKVVETENSIYELIGEPMEAFGSKAGVIE